MPTRPPCGPLEQVASLLLHRAAPLDRPTQALICARWGLPELALSPWTPGLDPDASKATGRLTGGVWRLRRLAAATPPPSALLEALHVAQAVPDRTQDQLSEALRSAGLSTGPVGSASALLLGLADLWDVPVGSALDPPPEVRAELARTARAVHAAGVATTAEVPAGHAHVLRGLGVAVVSGHLVAVDDRLSLLARPVRRQLAAVGALPVQVLLVGARRERPALGSLSLEALQAWAGAQHDVTDVDGLLGLTPGGRWLRDTDPVALALFTDQAVVSRVDILRALVESGGMLDSAAQVWIVRCSWLRLAGTRGQYRLASAGACDARQPSP